MSESLMIDRNLITGSLADMIRRNRKDERPALIFGPPGVGKSEQVRQAGEEADTVIDLRLNSLDSIDLRGLPTIQKDEHGNPTRVVWVRPEFIPWEGRGILFLDEINTAAPSVQNPALQLVLDRRIGSHELGKDWYICAAGNRAEDKAHVYPLSGALIDRFAVYDYLPDYMTWSDWAMKSGVHDTVIGFISFRKELLLQPRVDEYTPSTNPRSWSYVSRKLHNGHTTLPDIRACVGAAASEFLAYLDVYKNLPDMDKLISGKSKWKEDKSKISVSYAISTSLATHLLGSKTPEKILDNCMNVVLEMSPEPAALFVRRAMNSTSKIKSLMYSSDVVEKWLEKNRELISASVDLV